MKLTLSRFLFLILIGGLFSSCEDEIKTNFTFRTMLPVYLEMSDVRGRVIQVEPPQPLESTGKIYIYEDYLLVNEPTKGIHILDNSDPANPINLNFIPIEGNMDLAVNNNILYADNYADLLAFDISKIRQIQLIRRVEDVFLKQYQHATGKILTFKDTVITADQAYWGRPDVIFFRADASFTSNLSSAGKSYGTGGSMARFTLMDDHLYAVDESTLRVFDVSKADEPKFVKPVDLGWGIETIFPFQQKLFIGSNRGMHIYDASTPHSPTRMAVYEHILACDPVVVNEQHAFVTLRSGNFCVNNINELHVLDIQNPYEPKLKKSYPMLNPHGLGLAGDYLFVAEGNHGLKSFEVSDVLTIDEHQLQFLKEMKSVDLIPGPKSLIVIGPDGVCQYDYSTPSQLKKLSCIQVSNPIVIN